MKVEPVALDGRYARLEPLSIRHLDELCAVGLDEELWRWIPSQICSETDTRTHIEAALEGQRQGSMLPVAMIEKRSGQAIGSTRYRSIDANNRRLEIGWTWISRPWQQTAVNTEAKYLMLRHAFETLRCIRVEFKINALNERSRRAVLQIGATEEGTFRRHFITPSGRVCGAV